MLGSQTVGQSAGSDNPRVTRRKWQVVERLCLRVTLMKENV